MGSESSAKLAETAGPHVAISGHNRACTVPVRQPEIKEVSMYHLADSKLHNSSILPIAGSLASWVSDGPTRFVNGSYLGTMRPPAALRTRIASKATDTGMQVAVDLPGVESERVSVDVEHESLILKVAPATEGPDSAGSRFPKGFEQRIAISDKVDREKVTARMNLGVLVVDLPFDKQDQRRSVPIGA